jgi:pimeloyl-ACP methyl ester carboxylesterase
VKPTAPPAAPPLALAADIAGAGPPLVCLHGFAATRYTWRHLVAPLASRATVIRLDLKGFGDSPKPRDGAYTVADHAAAVAAYLRVHDLRDVILVGHSFGGIVARAVTLGLDGAEAARVRALVLIGTPGPPQPLPEFIRLLRTRGLGPLGLRALPPRVLVRQILATTYHDQRRIPADAVAAYARVLRDPGTRRAIVETARHLDPAALDGLLQASATIRQPTLCLWGRHDRLVPLAAGERLARALPDARLVVIDDAGHGPHEETPAAVVSAVPGFLDELDRAAARSPEPATASPRRPA